MNITQINDLIALRADGGGNHVNTERDLWNALKNEIFKIGEVKELDVSGAFITANFDGTGLGTGDYTGWAICNGGNGTHPRGGRTSIGYDATNYPTLGAIGGSKDAVLVEHSHDVIFTTVENDGGSTGTNLNNTQTPAEFTATTSTEGEDGTNKNMQPYIVTLFIQRIA